MTALRIATDAAYQLAEGPFWDAPRQRLLWTDIDAGLVLVGSLEPDGRILELERVAFDGKVGAVAPAASGDWIVAVDGRIMRRAASGALSDGPVIVAGGPARRLNDGKPDPAGRYLVGTLDETGPTGVERLVRIDDPIVVLDDDLGLSNGLAWSVDGRTLFSVDTGTRTVYRRPWVPETGEAGQRSAHLRLSDGYPDGIAIDRDDHLWIAMWGLGEVHRYSPDGTLVGTVPVPAPHVSSVCFAGPGLRTLVITTALAELDAAARSEFPHAGRLFTLDTEVGGAPQALWSGSPF